MRLINFEDKTESDGTSDHACVPNEDKLLQVNLGVISKESSDSHEAHCSHGSSENDDQKFDDKELWWPFYIGIAEESEAKVSEDKCFSGKSKEMENEVACLSSLRRKIVPRVVGHHDSGNKQGDDAWVVVHLAQQVRDVAERENQHAFMNSTIFEDTEPLENKGVKKSSNDSNLDRARSKFDETLESRK